MKKYTYNFEIKDLLTQFVAAFDDTVIKRYDKNGNAKQEIEVRYVFAPKQRVMYDIVNKAQNITLPVVTVDLTSVAYDDSRVFNKLNNIHNYINDVDNTKVHMPVPVNLTVKMSMLCRYMQDLEQIITNFVPYSNPYIVIAWQEPTDTGNINEIRTEVEWDQSISMNPPTELSYSEKFRAVADTTFTIKGWLFRDRNEVTKPIYFIENNFINTRQDFNFSQPISSLDYSSFFNSLTSVTDTDTFTLSGIPNITNIYYNTTGSQLETRAPRTINRSVSGLNLYNYNLLGENFNKTQLVMLSSNNATLTNNFTAFDTTYTGSASGFLLPSSNFTILSDNVMNITIPALSGDGKFDIIIKNPAGWSSTQSIAGFFFTSE